MNVIELNEAFASQSSRGTARTARPRRRSAVNPNGGAIALGHPWAPAARASSPPPSYQLMRTRGKYALCTMCIGVGQGIAMILERV